MQLPSSVQLISLSLERIAVQLRPSNDQQGVLTKQLALKRLHLCGCIMCEGAQGFGAALRQLPSSWTLKMLNRQQTQMSFFQVTICNCYHV